MKVESAGLGLAQIQRAWDRLAPPVVSHISQGIDLPLRVFNPWYADHQVDDRLRPESWDGSTSQGAVRSVPADKAAYDQYLLDRAEHDGTTPEAPPDDGVDLFNPREFEAKTKPEVFSTTFSPTKG